MYNIYYEYDVRTRAAPEHNEIRSWPGAGGDEKKNRFQRTERYSRRLAGGLEGRREKERERESERKGERESEKNLLFACALFVFTYFPSRK